VNVGPGIQMATIRRRVADIQSQFTVLWGPIRPGQTQLDALGVFVIYNQLVNVGRIDLPASDQSGGAFVSLGVIQQHNRDRAGQWYEFVVCVTWLEHDNQAVVTRSAVKVDATRQRWIKFDVRDPRVAWSSSRDGNRPRWLQVAG
jgi:hypothetical protein